MSKVLVIKGANFSANTVAHITFDDLIPCTGISFSSDTVTITGYSPVTISYSVTPQDTTDDVTWESSDTDVVSVADGVLTVNGIGTCTITATCGNYMATATVTVSISYNEQYIFGNVSLTGGNGAGTIGGATDRVTATGTGDQQASYLLANSSGMTGERYPILFPANTKYIRFSFDDTSNIVDTDGNRIVFYENSNVGEGTLSNYIKIMAESSITYNPKTEASKTVAVPSGAQAICYTARFISAGENTAAQLMEAAGFTLEFLVSAE